MARGVLMRSRFSILNALGRVDWVFALVTILLTAIGCLFIYSASLSFPTRILFWKQIVWSGVGCLCFIAATLFDYRRIRKYIPWIYGGIVLVLVYVLLFGSAHSGAHRWIGVFGLTVQPSEFAKLGLVLALGAILSDPAHDIDNIKVFFIALVTTLIPCILIMIEPDLGTAAMFVPIFVVMLYCAGFPIKPLLVLLGVGLAVLAIFLVWIKYFPDTCPFFTDYQKNRILVFLNMSKDPLGAGWNKAQSQIAVGSGGIWGKGYLKGTQNILGFLPSTVAPTDFIFSVITEESGFMGGGLVIGLYALLLYRCTRIAIGAVDRFGRYLVMGVATLIFCHVFVNTAMTIGLMPITGLPLPLISYGGSFMVSNMLAFGLVESVYVRQKK